MSLAPTVFVSYRRADTQHVAGRLYDRLVTRLSKDRVFMDVTGIDPGEDFATAIDRAMSRADVVLVLIGPGWLRLDAGGRPDPDDVVLQEVRAALRSKARVIPVRVDGAPLPSRDQLPDGVRDLARRQALAVDHASFQADTDVLLDAVFPGRPWWQRWPVAIAIALVIAASATTSTVLLVGGSRAEPPVPPPATACTPLGGPVADLLTNPRVERQNDTPGTFVPVPGGVQMTAPLGSDIRTENGSISAPVLGTRVGGDFRLEAQLQVAPTQPYSGAGLLLLRDPANYVRLERGIGSFDAIALEFAENGRHVKLHGPFRGEPLPVRTEAVRVGLRLERRGDQVSASWRDVSADGPWQSLTGTASLSDEVLAGATVLDTGATDGAEGLVATLETLSVTCAAG
jgi:hypothetical protein